MPEIFFPFDFQHAKTNFYSSPSLPSFPSTSFLLCAHHSLFSFKLFCPSRPSSEHSKNMCRFFGLLTASAMRLGEKRGPIMDPILATPVPLRGSLPEPLENELGKASAISALSDSIRWASPIDMNPDKAWKHARKPVSSWKKREEEEEEAEAK